MDTQAKGEEKEGTDVKSGHRDSAEREKGQKEVAEDGLWPSEQRRKDEEVWLRAV